MIGRDIIGQSIREKLNSILQQMPIKRYLKRNITFEMYLTLVICESVGDTSGIEIGAKRILNNAFHETLLESNESEHRVRYSIDDGPSPASASEVRDYIGQVQLKPITLNNATFVEWSSSWESTSEEARDFCHQIYMALLKALADKVKQ